MEVKPIFELEYCPKCEGRICTVKIAGTTTDGFNISCGSCGFLLVSLG